MISFGVVALSHAAEAAALAARFLGFLDLRQAAAVTWVPSAICTGGKCQTAWQARVWPLDHR